MKNHRKNLILASLTIKLTETLGSLNDVFMDERPYLVNDLIEKEILKLDSIRKPLISKLDIYVKAVHNNLKYYEK